MRTLFLATALGFLVQSFATDSVPRDKPIQLVGATNRCEAAVFSHDGRSLAAFLANEGVKIFTWPDGKETAHLPIRQTGFGPLAWSSTELIAAGGPEQKSILLWKPPAREPLRILQPPSRSPQALDSVAFSPTGDLLAVGDRAGAIFVYAVGSGQLDQTFEGHVAGIFSLAWSPDGTRLAAASGDNDISIWKPHSGTLIRRIDTLTHATFALTWSRDSETLYTGGASGKISAWNSEDGSRLRESERQADLVLTLALSSDERSIAAGGLNPNAFADPANVTIYDAHTFEQKRVIHAQNGGVMALSFSRDDNSIISASDTEIGIKVWKPGLASARELESRLVKIAELKRSLQLTLDDLVATNSDVPGAALHLHSPRLALSWSGAAGLADRQSKARLTPEHPVRIASNTKTFVAVATLRIIEMGKLKLDDPVEWHISEASISALKRGGYAPSQITIRHLLTHTAGLVDFYDNKDFIRLSEENPRRRWTRAEQLNYAMTARTPMGPPGKVFSYVDTGYILLGEILELRTGRSLAEALRKLAGYSAAELNSTWLESLEPAPSGVNARAHQYHGDRDTHDDDPSSDLYGGGGLVSTVGDLDRFMRAVFTGKVYSSKESLKTMLTTIPAEKVGPPYNGIPQKAGPYRMGVSVDNVRGYTVYSHGGYWGTYAAYVPALDLSLGASITQQKDHESRTELLMNNVLVLVHSFATQE